MKQINEYSEKEKNLFKSIMDLLNQGYRIHELKVADIAAAAGIGKSTVYEYFTTKEEIISQAVSYYVYREYERYTALISEEHGFVDIIEKIMDYTVDMLKSRFCNLLFIVFNLGESEIKELICKDRDLFITIQSGINNHFIKMFEIGRQEKLIGEDVSFYDCKLVLNGIISAFTNEIVFMRNKPTLSDKSSSQDLFPQKEDMEYEEQLADLKERSLQLILKALK